MADKPDPILYVDLHPRIIESTCRLGKIFPADVDHAAVDLHHIDGLDPAVEHFRPFHTETHRLRLWGLRGEKTTIVWLRDKQADWRNILEKGQAPGVVAGERLPRTCRSTGYSWYLPWEGKVQDVKGNEIPSFTRSAVVRFPTVSAY